MLSCVYHYICRFGAFAALNLDSWDSAIYYMLYMSLFVYAFVVNWDVLCAFTLKLLDKIIAQV